LQGILEIPSTVKKVVLHQKEEACWTVPHLHTVIFAVLIINEIKGRLFSQAVGSLTMLNSVGFSGL